MYGTANRREPAPVLATRTPPQAYFVVSAVFHYLGPAFAVLLFARVDVLGVAWLRVATAALLFVMYVVDHPRLLRRVRRQIVTLDHAYADERLLRDALERGETVGLLGDRDITGGGIDTELFGAPAPLAAARPTWLMPVVAGAIIVVVILLFALRC